MFIPEMQFLVLSGNFILVIITKMALYSSALVKKHFNKVVLNLNYYCDAEG